MRLTTRQQRDLLDIERRLRAEDPELAHRFSVWHAPLPTARGERAVTVLLQMTILMVLCFLPLALGVAIASPALIVTGLLVAVLGMPSATLWVLHRAR